MKCKRVQDNKNIIKICVFESNIAKKSISKDNYCLPLLETRLNEGSEIGQSRGTAVESVVPAIAVIVKLSWLRLQSIMIRPSAVLPIIGRLRSASISNVPSPLLSYMNTQPVATVLSLTVHDIFSEHWLPREISWTWYS